MISLFRRFMWWLRPHRKEDELREELQFHLEQEAEERRRDGLPEDKARFAARRDLGNEARVREEVRAVWTWRPLDELSQDLRFAFRTLFKTRAVARVRRCSRWPSASAPTPRSTASWTRSCCARCRSPIRESLVVMSWRSKPFSIEEQRVRAARRSTAAPIAIPAGVEARIFPFPAYERLREVSAPVLSSLFAHKSAGTD